MSGRNRWLLPVELRKENEPTIKDFINILEDTSINDTNKPELNLSDTGLSPYTLAILLEGLGYKQEEANATGWEMDFQIVMTKDGFRTLLLEEQVLHLS